MELAAEPADRLGGAQQRLGRRGAERDQHLGLNDLKLFEQEGLAGEDLLRQRVAVVRRATLQHVADEDVVAGEAHRFDHLGEQLARLADEGDALAVLLKARGFADEHEASSWVALTEDRLRAGRRQAAPRTALDLAHVEDAQPLRPVARCLRGRCTARRRPARRLYRHVRDDECGGDGAGAEQAVALDLLPEAAEDVGVGGHGR